MPDANPLPAKERLKIPRVHMPELDADLACSSGEVTRGWDSKGLRIRNALSGCR